MQPLAACLPAAFLPFFMAGMKFHKEAGVSCVLLGNKKHALKQQRQGVGNTYGFHCTASKNSKTFVRAMETISPCRQRE